MSFNDPLIQALSKAFDTAWPGPRGRMVNLSNGDLSAVVCPDDGSRIASLKYKGIEFLRQYNPERRAFQYGCFPMVPFPGRLRNGEVRIGGRTFYLYQNKGKNAMHGMAHFSSWKVEQESGSAARLSLDVGAPWPFPCRVVHTIRLEPDCLSLELEIETSHCGLPVDAGWHPWFLKRLEGCGGELEIRFNPDCMDETGSDELPTGRKLACRPGPWDDCFEFDGCNASAVLSWGGARKVSMTSNCPALVVFNKQPDAACVNPMTGIPNGLNTNPHLISPILKLHARSLWKFS
jgi:aldose 1-epimerase